MSPASQQSRKQPSDPERHFLIFCDESGFHGKTIEGFGSLWMPWERRGDFAAKWNALHDTHFSPGEVKWKKVTRKTLPFFEALVDWFFATRWLMFHCLVYSRAEIDMAKHDGDKDLQRRKHFTMLLAKKIKRFAAPGKVYRIRVDPIHSRYAKADEAAEVILRRLIEQEARLSGTDSIHSLLTVDSKDTPGVQLCDLLLGAVMAARDGKVTSAAKLALIARVAEHLGWPDLQADTYPDARKFNVWRFWDPTSGTPRPEATRGQIVHPKARRWELDYLRATINRGVRKGSTWDRLEASLGADRRRPRSRRCQSSPRNRGRADQGLRANSDR
jgi:hypothetical protein